MALKLCEYREKFMIDTFLIVITQSEKAGSIKNFLFRCEIRQFNSIFEFRSRKPFK